MAGHPTRQVAAMMAWLIGVAVAVDFGLFSIPGGPWLVTVMQVGAYALTVAPIIIWAPQTLRSLRMPALQLCLGMVVVVAAIGFAAVTRLYRQDLIEVIVRFAATGVGEELAFRGFIWQRLGQAGLRAPLLVAWDVILFTVWHLPSVAAGDNSWSDLIGVALFGTIFCIVRLYAGNAGLPALLHMASDVAGV